MWDVGWQERKRSQKASCVEEGGKKKKKTGIAFLVKVTLESYTIHIIAPTIVNTTIRKTGHHHRHFSRAKASAVARIGFILLFFNPDLLFNSPCMWLEVFLPPHFTFIASLLWLSCSQNVDYQASRQIG
jgi:hypothetical protein